jgi:phosphate transport system ATP-binding protein
MRTQVFIPHSTQVQEHNYAIQARDLNVFYGDFQAVRNVDLPIERQKVTAIIGPSGCGKSTVLRAFNRMNELVPTARTEGEVIFANQNIYAPEVDPVEVRHSIGMVFQKPNPFPKSIYENVAWGARINGFKGARSALDEWVEQCLRSAAIWDEVKDKLTTKRTVAIRRATAALVHCPHHRRPTRYHPDGRARLSPGPSWQP